eukprot:g25449.t1
MDFDERKNQVKNLGDIATSVASILDSARPDFKSTQEALAFVLHCAFLEAGCILVGLQESGQNIHDIGNKPTGWNARQDLFTFRYLLPVNKEVLIVKMLPVEASFMLHAGKREDSMIHTLVLNQADYVKEGDSDSRGEPVSKCWYKSLPALLALFMTEVAVKVVPSHTKQISVSSASSQAPPRPRRHDALHVERPPRPRFDPYPDIPQPVPDFGPLHPGPGRIGIPVPGFGGGDFGGDLDPLGGDMGGSLVGPGQFPAVPGQAGPGPFIPRGFRPRHDPFGPGRPRPGNGEPDPDHLNPGGGDPDFI